MSNRARMSMAFSLAVLPLLGLYVYADRSLRSARSAYQDAELLHQVERVGLVYDRILTQTEMLLGSLSEMEEIRNPRQPGCHALLARVMSHLTYYTAIQLIGVDGFVSCGSLAIDGKLFVGDRYYHRVALANRQFTVGNFVVGRLTGKPVVGLAYPVDASETSDPTGVLAAYLDLDELANRAYELGMPRAATFTVVNRDGVVMARVPARQEGPDTAGAVVPASFPAPTGEADAPYLAQGLDLDGVERSFAVRPLRAVGSRAYAHVYFGVDDQVFAQETGSASISRLQWVALLGLLVIVGAWLVAVRTPRARDPEPSPEAA